MRKLLLIFTALLGTQVAAAAVQSKPVEYKHGRTKLEGHLVWDDAVTGKRPAVLLVHEWMGLDAYARKRADDVAALGYVVFALDMYGKGVKANNTAEAGKLATIYKSDRKLMRDRAQAGLAVLLKNELVDARRVAVMGYCFGGTVALELARSGAPLVGAVSFHGGVDTPHPGDAQNIKGSVLVLHGADDPHVPPKDVDAFMNEMRAANVDWQFIAYGDSVHGFTNPKNGEDNSKGAAYNKKADERSWKAMTAFFEEIFEKP